MRDMGQIVSRWFEKNVVVCTWPRENKLYIKIIILLIVEFLYYISFYNDDFGLDNIILWTGGSKFEGSWVWDNGKKKEMIFK